MRRRADLRSPTRGSVPAALLVATLLFGCSSPPEALLEETKKAEEEAEEAGATLYASALLDSAQTAFAAADNELAVQKEKLAPLRNYSDATEKLEQAQRQFQEASKSSVSAKNSQRGPVRTLMRETNSAVDAAEQLIAKRILVGAGADLQAWQDEIASLRRALAEASKLERAENYPAAKATLDSAAVKVQELIVTLQGGQSGAVDGA